MTARFPALVITCVLVGFGCDKGETTSNAPAPQAEASSAPATEPTTLVPQVKLTDWCPEHSVPESVCTRCNKSLIADFKANGDWCEKHDLPDSQCIVDHPELKAKFEAMAPKKG